MLTSSFETSSARNGTTSKPAKATEPNEAALVTKDGRFFHGRRRDCLVEKAPEKSADEADRCVFDIASKGNGTKEGILTEMIQVKN